MEILKKTPYIFEKWNSLVLILGNFSEESFSYISGNGTFLYFRKWKPRKKSFIFYQKKAFLIFQEMETPQKFFIFQEIELSYI